jgi:flagellar L-ring protein FlgH
VSSAQVSELRVEYRTASRIDRADVHAWFSRFFMSLVPF